MKKAIFILSAALVALVGCSKVDKVEAPDKEIGFQVADYLNQTKAGEVAFEYTSFGVYAWYDAANGGTQHQSFIPNKQVQQSGSDWKVTEKRYYWPKTGDVDFIAYYPYAASPWISITDTGAVGTQKANHINGTATNLAGTEDLMYASKASNYNANVDPATYTSVSGVAAGVPTLFHHALAKVSVKFQATSLGTNPDIHQVIITKAYFDDVYKSGTLSMDLATDNTGVNEWTLPTNNVWTATGSTSDIDIVAAASPLTLTTSAQTALSNFTVLPQALTSKKLHLELTIKSSNDNGSTWYSVETVVTDIALDSDFSSVKSWKMNTSVTYNISIEPSTEEIIFDPAEKDWTPVSGSITIN